MNLAKSNIKDYLEWVKTQRSGNISRRKYYYSGGIEHFVLENGREYRYRPFDSNKYRIGWGTVQQCYRNAYHLSNRYDNLTYVEGFAHNMIPGVPHAWCVDEDGFVIDNTWKDDGQYTRQYYGVPFDIELVDLVLARKGTYGVFEDYRSSTLLFLKYKWNEEKFKKELLCLAN